MPSAAASPCILWACAKARRPFLLKTVHRTVFLTQKPSVGSRGLASSLANQKKKAPVPNSTSAFLVRVTGLDRLLRLRLTYYRLVDRCVATVPASPLLAKNSPPDCFLNAQTFSGPSPVIQNKKQPQPKGCNCFLVRVTGLEPAAS